MKKIIVLLVILACTGAGVASNWVEIRPGAATPAKVRLTSSSPDRSVVQFSLDGFYLHEVLTPRGTAYTISVGKSTPILAAGCPDLPKLTTSLIIPDRAGMGFRVVSSSYKDFRDLDIAPSKGNLMRDVDPATVPYQYSKVYAMNRDFPGNLADAREPFIIREVRGQTLIVNPFQYNPVTRTLRVYYDLTVEFYKTSDMGVNPLIRKTGKRLDPDFNYIYSGYFLNKGVLSYTPLADYGKP